MGKKAAEKSVLHDEDSRLIFLLILGTFAVVVLFSAYSVFIGKSPEGFTQVYLEKDYPSKAPEGKLVFSFFIESSEKDVFDYNYSILANSSLVKKGTVRVSPGEKKEINESIDISLFSADPLKVSVEVRKQGYNEPYSLWFWVSRR